ncbi:MAG: acetyl-CoA C-acyltransferase, partial [Chloroflexota bacterium]
MPRAVILGGSRTPFVRAGTAYAELDVLDLARAATIEALARCEVAAEDVDEVVYGNVSRPVAYHNLAREIVLGAGLPKTIEAFSVSRACATAFQAMTSAAESMLAGQHDVAIVGG